MNILQYNHIINKPFAINEKQTIGLDKIIIEFPFFQSARALYLKGLYNQNSYLYNQELKRTAAHTSDRSVLFDFITSDDFIAVQKKYYDDKLATINNIQVNEVQIIDVDVTTESKNENLKKSILTSIENASVNIIQNKLEIGKPLQFASTERHSFQEWLQISRLQPIVRQQTQPEVDKNTAQNPDKKKKLDLIDKFIIASPKIPKIDKNVDKTPVSLPSNDNDSYIMTETLAKVYLEQKKYDKAIQAYKILILKYPEKSSIFAIRIQDIKSLQQQ